MNLREAKGVWMRKLEMLSAEGGRASLGEDGLADEQFRISSLPPSLSSGRDDALSPADETTLDAEAQHCKGEHVSEPCPSLY